MSDFFGVSSTCLTRLLLPSVDDDSVAFGVTDGGGGLGRFPAVTNGCLKAAWGLILRSGSQTRHFAMKSTKSSSLHLRTCASVLVPGRRRRPLELITARGAPLGSKKSFFRELRLTYSLSGTPRTSMMQESCSCSFSPGNIGKPVYSSARMQPKLHMSMAMW